MKAYKEYLLQKLEEEIEADPVSSDEFEDNSTEGPNSAKDIWNRLDIASVVIDGTYPDIFVQSAEWDDGISLSDEELDNLNNDSDFVYEIAQQQKYGK